MPRFHALGAPLWGKPDHRPRRAALLFALLAAAACAVLWMRAGRATAAPMPTPLEAAVADAGLGFPLRGGAKLRVVYGNATTLNDGAAMLQAETARAPSVNVQASGLVTLMLVDPDAPSPDNPTMRNWLHWLVANVAPGAIGKGNGDTLMAYAGPTPPKGTHRYIFLIFDQPGGKRVNAAPITSRGRFSPAAWVKANLGPAAALQAPVAGAFFTVAAGAARH